MSKFSDVYDSLLIEVGTLFPTKVKLSDSIDLDNNPFPLLKNAYGIKVGDSSTSDLTTDYLYTDVRTFSILFTAEVYDLAINNSSFENASKALIDDVYTLRERMLDLSKISPILGGENITCIGDTGIENKKADKGRFIYVEVSFTVELTQVINR